MFPGWDYAEAKFSQWAVKRVCKFLLKKRLGHLILGDIDLEQLEVQLVRGTIQLSDLALNVEFLNEKFSGAAVVVKEGSIASLSIKIPWQLKNCQIEVEELELVLAPNVGNNVQGATDSWVPGDVQHVDIDSTKLEPETAQTLGSISVDVHEGVKTIAKIAKWFLSSFHVRLKSLIVAFDPCQNAVGKRSSIHRSLVLRIAETEYGTCVSEETTAVSDSKLDSLLGIAKLTNFIKFKGAVLEFLSMEDVDNRSQLHSDLGTSFSEWHAGSSSSSCSTTVLTGSSSGFSGTLNLSIPWKNGSLDVRRVDADVSIDPMELRIDPSIIKWIIIVWESLNNIGSSGQSFQNKTADSVYCSSRAYNYPSPLHSSVRVASMPAPSAGYTSENCYSVINQGTLSDALNTQTVVIHNWVSPSINQEDQSKLETDYSASVDQFISCFDGMRSSQASSGNSGIWNWTCSVFNAITVASNLASGSGQIPTGEQQHSETNMHATIAGISIVILLHSEDQKHTDNFMSSFNHMSDIFGVNCNLSASNVSNPLPTEPSSDLYMSCLPSLNVEHSTLKKVNYTNLDIHHLDVRCETLVLDIQICRQTVKFQGSVMHINIGEYYDTGNICEASNLDSHHNTGSCTEVPLSEYLQKEVQNALPSFPFAAVNDSEKACVKAKTDTAMNISHNGFVKVMLFESFGLCSFHYTAVPATSDGRQIASTSFSVNLPPFIFWVHFQLVNMLLNLFKEVETSFERSKMARDSIPDVSNKVSNSCLIGDGITAPSEYITSFTPEESTEGNIILSHARVILCFPSEEHGNFRYSNFCDKFIALEFSPCRDVGKVSDTIPVTKASNPKGSSCTPSTFIHLNIGKFESYLVTSARGDGSVDKICTMDGQTFSALKLLSVSIRSDDPHSGITMLWQKGPVTGSWMASRTWSLATPHNQRRSNVTGKGSEFFTVTTAENLEETGSQVRHELILSSKFFLHIRVSHVSINLGSYDYRLLNHVFSYIVDGLSGDSSGTQTPTNKGLHNEQLLYSNSNPSQASVLVECDVLDFSITLDELLQTSYSIQKELGGSWKRLRLVVKKLELLSVTNIGEIRNSNFFWLNHGEGELWGSLLNNVSACKAAQDFLLVTFKHSALKRGDGDGVNTLSFGTAGTFITHILNPQSLQTFTSIIVQCATIIAPGGRFDWVNAICFFFSLPSSESEQSCPDSIPKDAAAYKASFFLEFVDIALSYEPYAKDKLVSSKFPDIDCNITEQSGEQSVACFLAAASLYLGNHNETNSGSTDYKFRLQDVGLFICEWTGSRAEGSDYSVDYLRNTGYVKVAQETLVEAVLRTKDDIWELECSDSHINLDSCHDTTFGLVRLTAQLQQLYSPDMRDAVVHLQSRWNTVQKARTDANSVNLVEGSALDPFRSTSAKLMTGNEDFCSVGLLNEILEDAFFMSGERDNSNFQTHVLLDKGICRDTSELNICLPAATESSSVHVPHEKSIHSSAMGTKIIESYCLSDLLPTSSLAIRNHSLNQDELCKCAVTACTGTEFENGGWYEDDSLMIVENHLSKPSSQSGGEPRHHEHNFRSGSSDPSLPCRASGVVLLKNIDLRWRMYAGYDYPNSKKNVKIKSNSNHRDGNVFLELMLSGMDLQYDVYPDGEVCATKLSVSVQDFHLYDRSKDAPWRTVLGYYHSKDHPRESFSKAFKLDLEAVKPDPLTPLEEYRLHLEFLPMRLHLDQSQLNFLVHFFGNDSTVEDSQRVPDNPAGREVPGTQCTNFGSQTVEEEALLPFFQKCVVKPLVVRVDYIPRHIDLAALGGGNYAELLNLVPWKGIDLHLKHVCALGVYGWSSICETVAGEWLEDISHNQVHKLLKGLAPIRSLFAVSSGASKLVSLPVKSYKKDHKLLKGIQRGAIAFVKSISLEAVGLGVHLSAGVHEILLQAEYVLTPLVPISETKAKASVRAAQPNGTQQGIQQACESLSDGFSRTASALVGTPFKTYQRGAGAGSALAAAIRSAPVAAIAPVSASARALHCALLGVRNSLDPERKRESMEKYLGPSQS